MLSTIDKLQKWIFDKVLSVIGICITWWLMVLAWIVASIETKSNGLFIQERIGREGKPFFVFKIKTMRQVDDIDTTVTTSEDSRITTSGAFFRKTKIDELPQLFNVLFGTMSFVGPRPDVAGFADMLEGEDRIILTLRPGITGPASLKYKDEEILLARQENPEVYNRNVIWQDKIKINKKYVSEWSFKKDIMYIIKTVLG
jgi:lipopolysaccharide/colanic/teichoic acid biosynthesis glycosyltransferase